MTNFPSNCVLFKFHEHKKLHLPIYTRMMDFLREKAKEGIENCRFLFITFLIVWYTSESYEKKNSTLLPGSRSMQGLSNFMQLSLTVLSNSLRITITGLRNIWRYIWLLRLLQSVVLFSQDEMSSSFISRRILVESEEFI